MQLETATREVFARFSLGSELAFYLLAVLTLLVFCYGVYLRVEKYRRGRAVDRFDRLGARVLRALQVVARNATVTRNDLYAGLAHLAIMWGFIVLLLGTAVLTIDYDVVRPLRPSWRFWKGDFYLWYSLLLDLFGLALLAGTALMVVRRLLFALPQLDYTRADRQEAYDRSLYVWDDWIFLGLLSFVTLTGFLVEGVRIAQSWPAAERAWSPVGWTTAIILARAGLDAAAAVRLHFVAWWIHALPALGLVAYLPYSKASHALIDLANLMFRDETAARQLPAPTPRGGGGYEQLEDFTWKELLDLDACTRCGRCHVACPAQSSGLRLSPRDLILDLREYADAMALASRARVDHQLVHELGRRTLLAEHIAVIDGFALAGNLVPSEALWSCTTCAACMEVCPVGVEHVPLIVQLRRSLVQRGEIDENLSRSLRNLMRYGNSFGQPEKRRAIWTQGLDFKPKDARKEPVQWLWCLGEYNCYHPVLQPITRALARILQAAKLDYGILYEGERNFGNDTRRVGEEGLFDLLRERNTAVLRQAKFNDLFSMDPHVYNTLKNEYPELNHGRHRILHHTELLAELVRQGRLKPARRLSYRVTYHDPCYLGRYNGVYEPPRAVLRALGTQLKEMPRSRSFSFCCGGGGGRVWMEEIGEAHSRPSESRVREAAALDGVEALVVSCPKDYVMFTDALKTTGLEGKLAVKDLTELVAEAM